MKYIYIDIWYNEQHYIHISVMSENWMPKNKFSLFLNNCWFSGKLSTNTRWRAYLDSRPNRMQINLTDIRWALHICLEAIWLLEWSIGIDRMSISPYLQNKVGHIKRTACGSAEFESWKWCNVKMYADDISFQSDLNVSLRNILWACFGNPPGADANWTEVKTS